MKVRILFDIKDNVLAVVEADTDIDLLIKNFIEKETYGKLIDIEYWEGGSYDLIKNEEEYDIFISGDNGIFEMYTDTHEVENVILIKDVVITDCYHGEYVGKTANIIEIGFGELGNMRFCTDIPNPEAEFSFLWVDNIKML